MLCDDFSHLITNASLQYVLADHPAWISSLFSEALLQFCRLNVVSVISRIAFVSVQFMLFVDILSWEPDRRSNFFFSPPAHLCADTCVTELLLIVTLNNQFNSTQLNLGLC